MPVFLGFFINTTTRDEFVAPVEANDRKHAEDQLHASYPAPAYSLLTTYERRELDNIMAGIDRWPGLPSKIQPPLDALLGRVRVSNGTLPPLPTAKAAAKADGAQITREQVDLVRQAVKGHVPEVQALAARLLAAQREDTLPAPTTLHSDSTPASEAPSAIAMLKQMRGGSVAVSSAHVPTAPQPTAQPRSLIDVLKQMRG